MVSLCRTSLSFSTTAGEDGGGCVGWHWPPADAKMEPSPGRSKQKGKFGETPCIHRGHYLLAGWLVLMATHCSWKTVIFCTTATTSLCATVILGKDGWTGMETTGFEILRLAL